MTFTYSVKVRKDGIPRIGRDARTLEEVRDHLLKNRNIVIRSLKTPCWEWTGLKGKSGYGAVFFRGKIWRTHRLSWFIKHGKIPDKIEICHDCDNPPCLNPAHLFMGTHLENMQNAKHKKRLVSHQGEDHGCSKLNEKQVTEIRSRYVANTNSVHILAKEFKVSKSTILLIATNRIWKHIPMPKEPSIARKKKIIRENGFKALFGSDHCNAKLDDETVKRIRADYASGIGGHGFLAKKFGVHKCTIQCVVTRKTWKHVC